MGVNNKYSQCIEKWDNIFSNETKKFPNSALSGNTVFDNGLEWTCKDTKSVLDFGCGNGTLLFLCSLYGTNEHLGIDLSKEAINSAIERTNMVNTECSNKDDLNNQMQEKNFKFIVGGIEKLNVIDNNTLDAVVLSNIIDNLYPDDAETLIKETYRILKPNGKMFIKLNPYITDEQIKEWNIKIIDGNLLDDGLILWNNTTEQWNQFIGKYFTIHKYNEIFYKEHDQYNRLFLCIKK